MGKMIDKNDFWFYEGTPISKAGVFPYLGRQISPDLDPNKIYNVYRPLNELNNKKTIESFKLLPVVDGHGNPKEKETHGTSGENVYFQGDKLKADLKVFSNDLQDTIANGKKEISIGYACRYEPKRGQYQGQTFDFIQRDIRGNHIALVEKGRSGEEIAVADEFLKDLTEGSVYAYDTAEALPEVQKFEDKKQVKTNDEEELNVEELKEMLKALNENINSLKERKKVSEDGGPGSGDFGHAGRPGEVGGSAGSGIGAKRFTIPKNAREQLYARAKGLTGDTGKAVEKFIDDNFEEEAPKKAEDTRESVMKEIAERDELYSKVSSITGDFDKARLSKKEVAKYACDHLKLTCDDGMEVATISGYLAAYKPVKATVSMAADSIKGLESEDLEYKKYTEGK